MPTGGVSVTNMASYLALPSVKAVGGSWLVPSAALKEKDWKAIEELARAAVRAAAEVRK